MGGINNEWEEPNFSSGRIVGRLNGIGIPRKASSIEGEIRELLEDYEHDRDSGEPFTEDMFFVIAELYFNVNHAKPPSAEELRAVIVRVRSGHVDSTGGVDA